VGATVEGRVRNLTSLALSSKSRTESTDWFTSEPELDTRVKHPSEILKKGDKVKAIILAIEPDKRVFRSA